MKLMNKVGFVIYSVISILFTLLGLCCCLSGARILGFVLILIAIIFFAAGKKIKKEGLTYFGPNRQAPVMDLRKHYKKTDVPCSDYVVIDTETTGLDAKTCEVIEIGAIKYRNHQEVAQYHTYVRPEGRLSPDAARVNHITWNDVKDGKSIIDAVVDLMSFVGEDTVIGYNIGFDIKFLQTRAQCDFGSVVFDVLEFARRMLPGRQSYKLQDLKTDFGIDRASHNAIDDCATTAAVYQYLLSLDADHK